LTGNQRSSQVKPHFEKRAGGNVKRSTDRILVTHVGSLVRPDDLVALLAAKEQGRPVDEAAFEATLHSSVAEVVRKQAEVGVDIPSDGEYGKLGWTNYVIERLSGLEPRKPRPGDPEPINPRTAGRDAKRFEAFYEAYRPVETYQWRGGKLDKVLEVPPALATWAWECTSPIGYKDQEIKRDVANFRAAVAGVNVVEAFLPVAAPESARGVRLNRYYGSDDAFLEAIADALRAEYRAIIDAGFLIQLDDAYMAHEYDRLLITRSAESINKEFGAYIEMLNYALRDIPEDKVRYHVCWGSWNGPHTSDVPLRAIVGLILRVRAQAYSLEAANPRHEHEWQVWEDVKLPDGKILIPGLVAHSTNVVEHPELIAWRIKNFARLVGRENVIAGTDCGFSQNWNTVRVHASIQWAKLEALAQGARLASKELWRAQAA
jgi:5-methyltetrahydropteroyltriglutamate--homocysteine methyltransferase